MCENMIAARSKRQRIIAALVLGEDRHRTVDQAVQITGTIDGAQYEQAAEAGGEEGNGIVGKSSAQAYAPGGGGEGYGGGGRRGGVGGGGDVDDADADDGGGDVDAKRARTHAAATHSTTTSSRSSGSTARRQSRAHDESGWWCWWKHAADDKARRIIDLSRAASELASTSATSGWVFGSIKHSSCSAARAGTIYCPDVAPSEDRVEK
jgi:hypothetical protein